MDKLKRTTLNIDFRDDYNGRPSAQIINDYMIIKTHPFYCWESNRYGRCYRHDLFDLNTNKHLDNFKIYCYDIFDDAIDKYIIDVYNDIGNNTLQEYKITSDDFKINDYNYNNKKENKVEQNLFFKLTESNITKKDIINKFECGTLNNNEHGFICYNKKIYLLDSNFYNLGIYKKNSRYLSNYQDTEYCNLFVKNFNNILPNPNYTKYNIKEYERTQEYLAKKDEQMDDSKLRSIKCGDPCSEDSDSEEYNFYENNVQKNGKQIGQIFSCPGMLDICYILE